MLAKFMLDNNKMRLMQKKHNNNNHILTLIKYKKYFKSKIKNFFVFLRNIFKNCERIVYFHIKLK